MSTEMAIARSRRSHWLIRGGLGAAVLTLVAIMPLMGSQYSLYLNSQVLYMVLAAVSLNLLVGYTGLYSYGHVAFLGVGAYTFAILTETAHLNFWLAFFAGPVMAAAFALATSYFCVRLTEIYFSFVTLAVAQITWAIAYKWIALTGGDSGMPGVAVPDFLRNPRASYYFIAVVVLVLLAILYQVTHSPFGLILNTMRENPNRSRFIGVNIRWTQMVAFTLAGFVAGFVGVLFVINTRSIFPNVMLVVRSIDLMIMVVLGGMFHFWGPAIGAIIIVYLMDAIKARTEYWPLVLGILIAVVVLVMPMGVTGIVQRGYEGLKRWWTRRRGGAVTATEGSG